jgi:GGDEF domain-containing protein
MASLLKKESAKNGDFLARYGGDEFIIIVKASSDMYVIKL